MENIFLVIADIILKKIVKTILTNNGYNVIGESTDGLKALRLMHNLSLDLIILDENTKGISTLELADIITADRIAPILLLASTWSHDLSHNVKDTWILAFTAKPITELNLLPSIESVLTSYSHLTTAEKKVAELKKSLKERKTVEQAKGLLMQNLKLSEAEAYDKLRKQSMNKGIPLIDIARAVVLIYKSN